MQAAAGPAPTGQGAPAPVPHYAFIGNLPQDTTHDAVASLLAGAGVPAATLTLPADPHGALPHRGFAYAAYDSDDAVARAVTQLNGRVFNGRAVRAVAAPPGTNPAKAAVRPPALASSVRSAVEAMSIGELWAVASEIKALADRSADQAAALLGQYPMLTHALLRVEERLGMLQAPPPVLPPTPAALHQQHQQQLQQQQQQQMQQHMQQQMQAAVQPALGGGFVGGMPQQSQPPQPQQQFVGVPAVAPPPVVVLPEVPPIEDPEEVAMLRGILAMSDADVAALDAEQAAGVSQVRRAVALPLAAIAALPPGEREELLTLRAQLIATLGVTPAA